MCDFMKKHRTQKGFSLVELLIAMTLGLILISSMIAVFSGNKRSSELNSATADLQESARYAVEQISRDARMAGYAGCLRIDASNAVNVLANDSPTNDLRATIVTGSAVIDSLLWNPTLPGLAPPTTNVAKPGTHVLMLQYGGPDSTELAMGMRLGGQESPVADVTTFDNPNLTVGDLAIISNCEFGDLFEVTAATVNGGNSVFSHGAAANASGAFTRAYGNSGTIASTKLMKFHSNVYYVGENGQTNESGDPLYSLYQQSLPYNSADNPPVELVTGVENFRVAYGVRDPVTEGLRYVSANDALFDPGRVDAIRLGILMVSYDEVADMEDENTYAIAGWQIKPAGAGVPAGESHPKDRRIRLAFTTTITIRNRRNL